MSKWKIVEEEKREGGAYFPTAFDLAKDITEGQAKFDILQADIENGKIKLVDGTQELLEQAKLTDADKRRMKEEEKENDNE